MNINGWEFKPKGLAYGSIGYFLRIERQFTVMNEDSKMEETLRKAKI